MQAEHAGEPYKTIYKEVYRCYEEDGRCNIATCFRNKMAEGLARAPLTASEKEIVEGLFEEMPIYDPEMQIKLLAGKKQQLEKMLLKRENELAEKKKLYTTLGVMVGLLLILILI
jgi:stage III sporulation protein AB